MEEMVTPKKDHLLHSDPDNGLTRLQIALDSAEIALWEWDIQTGEVFFSLHYYRMLGYEPSDFPMNYDSWIDLVHPEDQKSIVPRTQFHLQQRMSFEEEFRMRCKDGQWRWVSGRGKVVELDERKQPKRIIGFHVDVHEKKLAQEDLSRFKQVIEVANHGVVMGDLDGKILYANPYILNILGYTHEELIGKDIAFLYPPDQKRKLKKAVKTVIEHGILPLHERLYTHRDGTEIPMLTSAYMLKNAQGKPEQFSISAVDIREMKEIEKQLNVDQERLHILIRSMDDIIFVLDRNLVFKEYLLPETARLLLSPEMFIGKGFFDVGLPPSILECADTLRQVLETGVSASTDYFIDTNKGREWFNLNVSPLHGSKEEVEGLICVARDISDRKEAEEALREMSIRDSLTGLINRRHLFERLEELMEKHERNKRPLSVAIFDLDFFKNVNDTIGHLAGDHILKEFSEFLRSRVRKYDLLARYGGEEFVVAFEECNGAEAKRMVERILKDIRKHTFFYKEIPIQLTFSCGISEIDDLASKAFTVDNLIDLADQRMYKAKQAGRNRVVFNLAS